MWDERLTSRPLSGLPKTQAAVAYVMRMHDGQRREIDGAPFVLHPLEVGSLLLDAGAPDHLIAAGVLHDTLEKTTAVAGDLRRQFGSRVAALVLAVSEDQEISGYARRKAALREQVAHADQEAQMLFAADKLSKVHELRLAVESSSRVPVRRRKLAHYRHCLRLLQDHIPDSALVRHLQAELGGLSEHPAREPMLAGGGL